jgi:hypothetical protein
MADSPSISNKAELGSYLKAINSAYLSTIREIDAGNVEFRVTGGTMVVRCACPALVVNNVAVGAEADTNPSDNQQVCEFPFVYSPSGLVPKSASSPQ